MRPRPSHRAAALIVAAGSGERLGAGRPKAFVPLGGRAMLDWSVEALRAVDAVEVIVVALPDSEEAPPGTVGVRGGQTRSHSVRAALAQAGDAPLVVVHDAARPLATPELFERTLHEVARDGTDAAIAATPVTDTIKAADADARVTETLDRARLWAVQTPQAFRAEVLRAALDVPEDVLAAATDDAWLVERAGGTVRVVESSRENLKVTEPLDLRFVELLLAQRT